MNYIYLIGKFLGIIFDKEKNTHSIILCVKRDFKNEENVYGEDIFTLLLPVYYDEIIRESIRTQKLRVNDYLSIQGRLEMDDDKLKAIVHKIMFLGG